MSNTNLKSSFKIFQTESNELCLIDPMMLFSIVVMICLILYIFEYKIQNN